jgi:AraC-like DNA-binding protein
MTLHGYVLARHMSRAQELLAKADLALAAAAQAAGFSSQSHFTAIFSTRVGLSPGSYRRTAGPVSVLLHGSAKTAVKQAAANA